MRMFWFVIGALLLIAAVPMFIVGNKTFNEGDKYDEFTVPFRFVGIGVAVASALFVMFSCSYSQDTGEAVLIKSRSGEVIDFDTSPGFGWTAPWNKTSTWDLRNKRITFEGNGDGDDEETIVVALDGSANASINQVVTYSLPRDREVLTRLELEHRDQGNFEQNVLISSLKSVVQDEAVKYGPYVIKEERGALDTDITNTLLERWSEEGAEVKSIEITGIALDEATELKLQEVTARQADVAEAEAALEAARIEGETVREEAKAQADADQIARCGATTRAVTREVSGREIETTEVIPIPDGQCQNRLNEQVLLNKWIEAMEVIGAAGNTIVVPDQFSGMLNIGGARVE